MQNMGEMLASFYSEQIDIRVRNDEACVMELNGHPGHVLYMDGIFRYTEMDEIERQLNKYQQDFMSTED